VLRRIATSGRLLTAVLAFLLTAVTVNADECCFAFFRRCPADAGAHAGAASFMAHVCRPPRCPPYCDPTFGFYPTAWRSWPTLYSDLGEDTSALPAPKSVAPGTNGHPAVMPPALEGDAKRRSTTPGSLAPTLRSSTGMPDFTGASAR
jgi:hypothetical protein